MKTTYSGNYIKIYVWQGISMLLGFASMLIVVPSISTNASIYGIYSVCISVSIFLSYADLGFLSAGQKYASEEFARNDLNKEKRIVGFSGFILFVFILVGACIFAFFSIAPESLIKGVSGTERIIARRLLLTLAISAPITGIQRITQMVYSIRIEDYIFQRFMILGNIVKLSSVFYFFNFGRYNIVGYYIFIHCMNFLFNMFALIHADRRYNYNIKELFSFIKFDKEIFNRTKKLAFSSLFVTVSWIIYYEFDVFVIGKIMGAEKVALYAIGLTLMTFFRSLLGAVFAPFVSRFNHYIGLKNEEGLRNLVSSVISISLPVITFTVTTVILFMKPLVFSWVGPSYGQSVKLAQMLIACNLFAYINYPGSILLSAKEKIKTIYLLGAILPFVYWVGVGFSFSLLGLQAFAVFKMVAFFSTALVYLFIIVKYLQVNGWVFFVRYYLKHIPSLLILSFLLLLLRDYLPLVKGKLNLLTVISIGAGAAIPFIVISLLTNSDARVFIKSFFSKKSTATGE